MDKIWCCADARPASELPPQWRDNVSGQCEFCKRAIMWRPHADPDSTKLCKTCTELMAKAYAVSGERAKVEVTETARAEFEAIHGSVVADKAIRDAQAWLDKMCDDEDD